MASASSPMPSFSAAATPNFELPQMPGSYEDFEFSLNLPENITASDLNLVASPDFSHFFGLSSNSMPSANSLQTSTGLTPVATTAHSFDASSSSDATLATAIAADSTPATPKGREMDDTVMSHGTGTTTSANAEASSTSTATPSSNETAVGSSSQQQQQQHPIMNFEPQTTSIPQQPTTMLNMPPLACHDQHNQNTGLYGVGAQHGTDSGNNFAMYQNMMQQQQAQSQMPPQNNNNGGGNMALFDANETSFLTNFLSGFEGWDFNPNLPMDLPSFADAEKLAFQYGSPQAFSPVGSRTASSSRQRSGASSMRNSKGSPLNSFNNYGAGNMSAAGTMYGQHDVPASVLMMMQQQQHQQQQNPGWPVVPMSDGQSSDSKKKIKTAHGRGSNSVDTPTKSGRGDNFNDAEPDKRSNHILSEQRRRNHIREAFKELVDMLEAGREFGARGLGLSSGAGTGIEDEGLDDRSDYESTLEDEEPSAATKRRKLKARKRAALEAARKAGARDPAAAAALLNGGAGRGKGRGRGGSAGGGAGSKSAVLFQAVDLLQWLNGRNAVLSKHVQQLEEAVIQAT